MPNTLIVSRRGQITLPAGIRRRLGIKGGDVMLLEDRGHELVLKPAPVVDVEQYDVEQIARWDVEDLLADDERARIVRTVRSLPA